MPSLTTESFDLVIAGGGPAGLAAALAAVEAGVETIALIEMRQEWGKPVRCAEYVPRMLARQIEIPPEAIAQRVERMDFFHAGAPIAPFGSLKAPGFILHRDRWEAALAARAAQLGVRLFQPSMLLDIDDALLTVRDLATGRDHELRARVVIGADGPQSLVRRKVFGRVAGSAIGVQQTLPAGPAVGEAAAGAEVHFAPEYGAGYAWRFPKGGAVHAGLALHYKRRRAILPLINAFVDQLLATGRIASKDCLASTGGFIPVTGPIRSAVRGRVLLCGDAAGHTHPLTGAGIFTAVSCGQMAAAAAARALRKNDAALLRRYDAEWQSLFGDFLLRGRDSARALERAGAADHFALSREAWRIPG